MRMLHRISLVALLAGALLTAPSVATAAAVASWPSAGHDLANTRSNPNETAIGTTTVAGLTKKWSVGFSSYLAATPAVADGMVFLADHAGKLSAFDAVTGALKWSHTVASYTGIAGDLGRATPAVSNGRVIFGDLPGSGTHDGAHVIAVSETTGNLLWKTTVDTTPTAKITGAVTVD